MALLDTFMDPALEIDLSFSLEDATAQEIDRLQTAAATIVSALAVPRRLGDVTREELSLDKKRARRVLHPLRQCLGAWGGKERDPLPEEQSAGAQIRWDVWYEEHCVLVAGRRLYLATWAKRTGQLSFGKSAVVRLSQELSWLEYAMR